jgi:glycosyltransferase involved in cell wall biosynthesis
MVPPAHPAALAAAIVATLADPAAARRRVELARERFLQRFTIDRVADQMLAFYDRALSRPANEHANGAVRSSGI